MKEKNLHIIQKQSVHLNVSRRENSLALQQRFERMLEEQLLPRLEPVFDRLAGPDVWVELDKLEIDAGYLDPRASSAVWLDKVYAAYVTALEDHIEKTSTVNHRTPSNNTLRVLLFFLERGHFPWWAAQFDLEMAIQKNIASLAPKIIRLLSSTTARQRWVRQFGEELQEALWAELAKGAQRPWRLIMPDLSGHQVKNSYWESIWEAMQKPTEFEKEWPLMLIRHTLRSFPGKAVQASFWQKLIQGRQLSGNTKKELLPYLENSLPVSFGQWRKWLPALPEQQAKDLYWDSLLESLQKGGDYVEEWLFLLVRSALYTLTSAEEREFLQQKIQEDGRVSGEIKSRLIEYIHRPDLPPRKSEPKDFPRRSSSAEEEGIFIPLAGTVLLHPFLPAFFQRLDLLEDEQFRDKTAQERAVHLLYFLATGLQHPREQEVVLLKLLCGLELETPIEKEIDLTENEKNEAEQMLRAVIQNWEVLEGSDPDDLRGSFLVREGKLQTGDMGWKLIIEQKPYDILLNKLPWGLSPIMHTWMREMIWVEWG